MDTPYTGADGSYKVSAHWHLFSLVYQRIHQFTVQPFFQMFRRLLSVLCVLLAIRTFAFEVELEKRACPDIHIFGARETTAPPGFGSAGLVVDLVLNAQPGSTAEAINYPACGGQSSCGDVSYADSVIQGVQAVTTAVNSFNTQCPDTQLVLIGYSQVCKQILRLPCYFSVN